MFNGDSSSIFSGKDKGFERAPHLQPQLRFLSSITSPQQTTELTELQFLMQQQLTDLNVYLQILEKKDDDIHDISLLLNIWEKIEEEYEEIKKLEEEKQKEKIKEETLIEVKEEEKEREKERELIERIYERENQIEEKLEQILIPVEEIKDQVENEVTIAECLKMYEIAELVREGQEVKIRELEAEIGEKLKNEIEAIQKEIEEINKIGKNEEGIENSLKKLNKLIEEKHSLEERIDKITEMLNKLKKAGVFKKEIYESFIDELKRTQQLEEQIVKTIESIIKEVEVTKEKKPSAETIREKLSKLAEKIRKEISLLQSLASRIEKIRIELEKETEKQILKEVRESKPKLISIQNLENILTKVWINSVIEFITDKLIKSREREEKYWKERLNKVEKERNADFERFNRRLRSIFRPEEYKEITKHAKKSIVAFLRGIANNWSERWLEPLELIEDIKGIKIEEKGLNIIIETLKRRISFISISSYDIQTMERIIKEDPDATNTLNALIDYMNEIRINGVFRKILVKNIRKYKNGAKPLLFKNLLKELYTVNIPAQISNTLIQAVTRNKKNMIEKDKEEEKVGGSETKGRSEIDNIVKFILFYVSLLNMRRTRIRSILSQISDEKDQRKEIAKLYAKQCALMRLYSSTTLSELKQSTLDLQF
ncbi:MAG: hypothetical protein QW054_00400 [Candidatus Micrarchaeia archaeon]